MHQHTHMASYTRIGTIIKQMDTTNLFSVTASDSTRHAGDATGLHSSRRMQMRTHQENRRTNEPTHGEHLALPVTHADRWPGTADALRKLKDYNRLLRFTTNSYTSNKLIPSNNICMQYASRRDPSRNMRVPI